nr:HD domain-containing protein [Fredinandcohnia sp. SECRCQ15]
MASRAHDGQYRKRTKTPYISHPISVGLILMKAGYRDELVAAAILHDTVEDTELTLNDIEQTFGRTLSTIVEGCSEPDKSLTWDERKEHTIEFLKTAPEDIRVVSCADKLHNVQSIIRDFEHEGDQVWERFNRGKDKQEWYYRSIIKSLGFESTFPLLKELENAVEILFGDKYNL